MSALAPVLEAFFTERLVRQRNASAHTVAAYRDTFRLFLAFVEDRTHKAPCRLDLADLDAEVVAAFLDHLEKVRGNAITTRNARLAVIHAFFVFAAVGHPEHAQLISRVLAIPAKRHNRAIVSFLTPEETDALLDAPDRATWLGRRDHALLLTAVQCGLRVSELCALRGGDVGLGTGAHVRCHGKGRKDRATPLSKTTAAVLAGWMAERAIGDKNPLFPTAHGSTLSRDAVAKLLAKHLRSATASCPSLACKSVTPHTLRHTAAMALLHAGVDITVIALWLGHEQLQTTSIYLHADMSIKEAALARTAPPGAVPGRYRPPDPLLAFLEGL
ncbi:MAG TPA: tyrosine-type recombinase/integrase [Acidimicrobiales bacterium]